MPTKIMEIMSSNGEAIWQNTAATLSVVIPGLVVGSVIGYLLAVLACFSPRFGATGLTVIAAISAVPIVALSAVMLQWTRKVSPDVSVRSFVMKLLIVVIVSVASMTLNAYRGLTELPPLCWALCWPVITYRTADCGKRCSPCAASLTCLLWHIPC